MLRRVALWGPLIVLAFLVSGYFWLHRPLVEDGTGLLQVPLSEADPELTKVGELTYLGGLDIPRMGQNIGGLSGLRWDAESGRLLAITDDARWVWITPTEENGQLTGIGNIEAGPLLGLNGEPLTGKAEGDSESLDRAGSKSWLVSFERNHRLLIYDDIDRMPRASQFDPVAAFGSLDENSGVEAMAGRWGGTMLTCVERVAREGSPNCQRQYFAEGVQDFPVTPPQEIAERSGVPTDADQSIDLDFYILFRSYSPTDGNGAAIVSYDLEGGRRELATFRPPLTVDNFEGLAVREEGKHTFLYIVSDDNFSGSQRTLLMKFEVRPEQ